MPSSTDHVNLKRSLSLVEGTIDLLEQDLPRVERMAAQAPHWFVGAVAQAKADIAFMLSWRDELLEQIAMRRVAA